jgi:glycosyltransferase involved in cell wall biosynthesis
MKLVVFAHTPPPHHGQSYMVKLMLEGFGGDRRRGRPVPNPEADKFGIECYHVDARLSSHLEDVGSLRVAKLWLLLFYCVQAIWCRFRHGATTFYYVPAPGKRVAVMRDWIVFGICRRFFKHTVLHWHAAGLARWLENSSNSVYRDLTYRAIGSADMCVVLSRYNYQDAEKLWPGQIRVVGNGLPDPCPDFDQSVLPRRLARFEARKKLLAGGPVTSANAAAAGDRPEVFQILYLAHCLREKGLFDTLDGVALAAKKLARDGPAIRVRLTVAGEFMLPAEEAEFRARLQQPDLLAPDGQSMVDYVGFVTGDRKRELFLHADCFCFPTYYFAENLPLVLVEAMAHGVPIVTSRWRSVPELFPADYDALVEPRSPEQVADAMLRVMRTGSGREVRRRFVENYRIDKHLASLAAAIHAVEDSPAGAHTTPPLVHSLTSAL